MAEIHIMPSWPATGRTTQLIATLARAFKDGIDLGSRRAHIDALVLSLREALVVMRSEVDPILQMLDDEDPAKRTAQVCLDRLADEVNDVIAAACQLSC